MKIIRLTAENFMRLVAVEIKPEDNTIMITGKNGAGKSSVLEAIFAAFGGKKALPKKPIRDGQDSAKVEIETEEFTVKLNITKNNSYLEITNRDGFKAKSPQALLDRIVGKIAFDPISFSREEPRQQRTMLMNLLALDFSDIDEQLQAIKINRSNTLREKERLQHEAERITFTANLSEEEVNVLDLTHELQAAIEHNNNVGKQVELHLMYEEDLNSLHENIQNAKADIEELRENVKKLEAKRTTISKLYDELNIPKPIDISVIETAIQDIEATNSLIRNNQQKKQLTAAVAKETKTFSLLGQKMKGLEVERADRLAKVEMPVEGLSVTEDCITYEGIPLSQVNSAKRLEVGIAISMALNPKLRVLRIDGNCLDSETQAILSKIVKDNNYQLWEEKTDESGKVGIVIEDGMIKKGGA